MSVDRSRAAADLRRAFDQSFVRPRGADKEELTSLLAVRIGPDPYAVRLSDVASLHADRPVTALPTKASGMLGLAGFRGALAPVYDLRTLFGYPGGSTPRWLLVVSAPEPLGLAFDAFDAHVRLPAKDISSSDDGNASARYVRGLVHMTTGIRPLIHIASIVEAITSHVQPQTLQRSNGR
ncbi:MAG: CheW domain-containing protein [Polyangiaceae bacterium]|nr:CheW domain-containing protein [Polyangiaceae bacterium]